MTTGAALALGLLAAAMLAVHMLSRRVRRIRLSQRRFLPPSPQSPSRSFALSNPLRSPPLYPRLAVLAAIAAALVAGTRGCAASGAPAVGLWLVVDSSLSMSTRQGTRTRMEIARERAGAVLDRAVRAGDGALACVRVSAFDLERRDLLGAGADASAARAAVAAIVPRPLGSDATLPLATRIAGEDEHCPVSHVVVITDLPVPGGSVEDDGEGGATRAELVWIDVSEPSANVGIERIEPLGSPVDGRVRGARVHLRAWRRAPGSTSVRATNDEGRTVLSRRVSFERGAASVELVDLPPGVYRIEIEPGGSYAGDDRATIELPPYARLPVDWRVDETRWLERLGWVHDPTRAALVVVRAPPDDPEGPTLVVGDDYRAPDPGSGALAAFREPAPFEPVPTLLEDVDLDVVEELRLAGMPLPEGYRAALSDERGRALVATRERPRVVRVPGFPSGGDEGLRNASTLIFANGVRWLLTGGSRTPLHTLTSPAEPEPEGTRIALHPGEGITDREGASAGDAEDLRGRAPGATERPAWPPWLALASALMVVERGLFALRGSRWL